MKVQLLLACFACILFTCTDPEKEDPATIPIDRAPYQLTLLWETDARLPMVESVLYDSTTQAIYTANIDGGVTVKDGKGSIGKLSLTGEIINATWVNGLNAPTGLGIYRGKLYTTDIDEIVIIDLASGEILEKVPVNGAQVLNDLAVGPDGTIYCSDTEGHAIYALNEGTVTKFMEDIESPNGLYVSPAVFGVVCWNPQTFYQVEKKDQSLRTIATKIRGLDGVAGIGGGAFLVSSYFGKLYHISPNGEKALLLDTKAQELPMADIDYVPESKLVLVPTLDADKVVAYRMDSSLSPEK